MAKIFEHPLVIEDARYITIKDGAGGYLKLPSLTTAQRDGLSAVNGMQIYNVTASRMEAHQNGVWGGMGAGAGAGSASGIANTADVIINADSDANATGAVRLQIGASDKLYIANSGNVGIGTTGPEHRLHSVGDSLVTGISYLGDTTHKALSASVAAQTIYVDAVAGSDTTGNGSAGAPFATIQKAVDVLPRVITRNTVIAINKGSYTQYVNTAGLNVLATLTFKAIDTAGRNLYDNGTATGGTATTLVHTGKTWATNIFAGGKIWIRQGTGQGQARDITSNTADTITISGTWTAPDTTSKYVIGAVAKFDGGGTTGVGFNFSNLRGVSVLGLGFIGSTAVYDVTWRNKSDGAINHCFFDGNRGQNIITQSHVGSTFNYYSIGSFQGVVIERYSSITPRQETYVAETAGVGVGIFAYRETFLVLGLGNSANLYMNLAIGIDFWTGAQAELLAHQIYVGNTNNFIRADFEVRALNPTGGNVLINTTTGNNVLTIRQGSVTDPIADAWTTYSLRKGKTILKDASVLDFDKTPVRRWKRKLVKPKLTDFEEIQEEMEDGSVRTREDQLADALEEYTKKKNSQKFNQEQFGLIAEEAPDCLRAYDDTGALVGINTSAYVGWLHAVVKEQDTTIKDLMVRVRELETGRRAIKK